MPRRFLRSSEVRPDDSVGGKARALALLEEAGLPVPAWFVMPSSVEMTPETGEELEAALALLGDGSSLYAVRSSADDEDSAAASFAGQLDSFLRVPRSEVAARIADVRRSGFSARLASYRHSRGARASASAPAVIVQRMVEGEVSGVAFSADPVSGRRALAVVAGVRGLAAPLVGGEADADTWWIDRERRIVARTGRVAIDEATALRVADLARAAERHFGVPQDIEWTLACGELFLLQSRPITTLADQADPDGVRALWDNSNIIESYSGITTPLTFSFVRRAYEHVYREFCRLIRVPEDVIEAHGKTFACMLGLFRGRVYYNLYNWYRLLAVLPGYRFNRRFMEQMMGVREPLPEDIAAAQAGVARWRDGWRLAVSAAAFAMHLAALPRRVRRFRQRLDEALGSRRPDLSVLRPDELVGYVRRLESRLLRRWDAPIVNDFATMIFHGLLRRLHARWISDDSGSLHNDLLCGEPGIVSEEPARRVAAMAQLAMHDRTLIAALQSARAAEMRRELARHPDLAQAIDAYLERFGERCLEELKLESTTLHEQPAPLYRAIGEHAATLAARGEHAAPSRNQELRVAANARVRVALAGHPLRRALFVWVLAHARECLRTRENLRFERTRVFGRVRQIFVELGNRLAALDCLQTPRDVFYLEFEELLAFVEARATTADLKGLAAVRKAEFERYRALPAPAERFETRGVVYRGHDYGSTAQPAPAQGASRKGLACCPGVVRGRVCLVRDPKSAPLRRGEILVAEHTDPGWVTIFPSAAGLLVERGSLLSHSAIVARELGLPTIVSLPGLTHWLADGDWVEMDGRSGIVTKVADGGHREAA